MGFFNLAETNIAITLKEFFSNKYIALLFLVLAIINKSIIAYLYIDLEGDKSLYLLFAANYLEHEQFLEPIRFVENGETYFKLNGAIISPLYSFIAAPILKLTGSFSQTAFIIDVLSWSVFFTGLYKLSNSLFKNIGVTALFILCAGFFIYPHELQSTPKDTLAVGLLFWTVYLSYVFINKSGILLIAGLSLLLTAFALTKFLYMPLVVVFLLVLLFYALVKKNKQLFIRSIFVSVLNVGLLWLIVFLLNNQNASSFSFATLQNPVQEFTRGFYPENIIATFPFISSSFINVNFWGVQLGSILKTTYTNVSRGFNILDLLILSFLIAGFDWIRKQIEPQKRSLFLLMLAVSLAILGMLVYMSVSYKGIQYLAKEDAWTYISEARSYLFIIVFLQLLLFYLIIETNLNLLLKNFLFLLFIIECAHGFYFTVKQTTQAEVIQKNIIERSNNKNIIAYANYLAATNDKADVKLITNDNHLRWLSNLYSIDSYTFSNNTNCSLYQFTPNTILLFATYEVQQFPAQKCMENYELLDIKNLAPFNIKVYKIQ